MRYKKLPVEIEAEQWNGQNVVDIYNFLEGTNYQGESEGVKTEGKNFYIKFENGGCTTGSLIIKTLEGDMKANIGDYIIKGIKGEYYPCKPDIFEKTYERSNI